VWGTGALAGRVVGVEGLGKVGRELVRLLVDDGAQVVATDVDAAALTRVVDEFPDVRAAGSVVDAAVDIYAPCALGGTLTAAVGSAFRGRLVCGAANNQLATPDVERILCDRGVTWVPDYVANAGGLIQVAGEVDGTGPAAARSRVEAIADRVREIFGLAATLGVAPGAAADRIAEARIDAV